MKVLLLDNQDSFTWNLVHAYRELGADVDVVSEENHQAATSRSHDLIVVGPGPRGPRDRPHLVDLVHGCVQRSRPLFGVCLGLQTLASTIGGDVVRSPKPQHGKTSLVEHDGRGVFVGVPSPLVVMRYHSLCVQNVPVGLVSAQTKDGTIMGLRVSSVVEAVQFHPESIGTEGGLVLLANTFVLAGARKPNIIHRRGSIPAPHSIPILPTTEATR